MPLPVEQVEATPQGLQYRLRSYEQPRALPWGRLRSISAEVEPAWSGAEVVVAFAFEGDQPSPDGVPLAAGRRLEVFGHVPAARALIQAAQERSPQALVGPVAQLLLMLPQPGDADEEWYRGKLKDYAFGAAAALALGEHHLAQGRLQAAARDFQRALRRDPRDTTAGRWLALTHLLEGKALQAVAESNNVLALGVRDPETHIIHGLSLYSRRGFEAAAEELRQVLRGQAADAAMRGVLACSLVQQWRIDAARRELATLAAGHGEGWRLMAQKCVICAEGHRAYQERVARDPWFRRKERWKVTAARMAAVIYGLFALLRYLAERRAWLWLIGLGVLGFAFYVLDRGRADRRSQEQLADAQGQVPNMSCWYVSLVWRGARPRGWKRSIIAAVERRLEGE